MSFTSKGTFVKLKLDGKYFVGETSTSLAMAVSMIETSSKVSGNASTFIAGRVAETMSVSSLGTATGGVTVMDVAAARAAALDLEELDFTLSEYDSLGALVEGALIVSGKCLISSVSADFPDNDNISLSVDLQVTGATTDGVNPA